MNRIESLHTHTILSDGKLTHKQVMEKAEALGISVVAFTDHDTLPGEPELAYLESVRNGKTKWIIGIEISASLPPEAGGLSNGGFHIIGLFLDPKNEALLEHCRKAQKTRIERMESIVLNLLKLGFDITAEECSRAAGGDSVGRPHIVEALLLKEKNRLVMEKIRLDMKSDAEKDTELKARYDLMMETGERGMPYALFLSPHSYRPAYVEHGYMPTMDETVSLIRGAGGIASVAHYFTAKRHAPIPLMKKILQEKRMDGMETVYALRHYGTSDEKNIEEERGEVRKILAETGGIPTGGADAHTSEDFHDFSEKEWFSGETHGMTEAILNSGKVERRWSSF